MIITTILVSLSIAIAMLTAYGFYAYGEMKGYQRGCKDSDKVYEDIIDELRGIKRDKT